MLRKGGSRAYLYNSSIFVGCGRSVTTLRDSRYSRSSCSVCTCAWLKQVSPYPTLETSVAETNVFAMWRLSPPVLCAMHLIQCNMTFHCRRSCCVHRVASPFSCIGTPRMRTEPLGEHEMVLLLAFRVCSSNENLAGLLWGGFRPYQWKVCV